MGPQSTMRRLASTLAGRRRLPVGNRTSARKPGLRETEDEIAGLLDRSTPDLRPLA
jgi:hypothetical protein